MTQVLTFTPNPCIDKIVSVPVLIADKKLYCSVLMRQPGGGGINVARVIRRLGASVKALFPSGGSTGGLLEDLLREEDIQSGVVKVVHSTRENIMLTETTTNRQFRLGMPGEALSDEEWRQCIRMIRDEADCRYIVISGSLPDQAPSDLMLQIAAIAREKRARLIVDSSGETLKAAVKEGAFLLKPNLSELASLAGKQELNESQAVEEAKKLVDNKCCEIVVVSMDARGALMVTGQECYHAIPPVVKPKSSVGAGDSMVGGMVYSLLQGNSLPDVFRMGVACGTAAIMNPGTTLCEIEDVTAIFDQVRILPIQ
ncbi:1-phosphofructokinase family hexose kinase [Pseudoflavitalea rhizosphaerae]|uniref:1-phosphofructokinase family hexose kinase n=1 Tax=Pseudoflavitalea rhizosphaerae TaxID=1884793 RepID=UPI0013DF0111|nr:1-phosphofructokinase family hexose kinase [Pseudoflavitalea rhizosphaerae]